MNKNWARWIFASIAKHFDDQAVIAALPLYIESAPAKQGHPEDWLELRIDGPNFSGRSKDEWGVTVEVNIVISSAKNGKNNYRFLTNEGLVCKWFVAEIPIFKLGNGVDDDQSFITCLQLITDDKAKLVVSHFGQIDATTQLLQSTVEGHYHANLNG